MIKFRAWYIPFGKYGAMQEMVHSRASHILALAETEPEKYIPEQFTGLEDMYGKDIYAGDIVHAENEAGYVRNGEVVFRDGAYWYDNGIDSSLLHPALGMSELTVLKVIGNVHTNSELLEA